MTATQITTRVFSRRRPQQLTLLELVTAVTQVTGDEKETTAVVLHMLRSGRVRLCGNFRGAKIEDLTP